MSNLKKIALFSNYSWAYTSATVARKYFPENDITLITANTEDVAKNHDFGITVLELASLEPKGAPSVVKQLKIFKGMGFDAAIIDYGFSLNTAFLLLFMNFKKIFMIDFGSKEIVRAITKGQFLATFRKKLYFFVNKILIHISMGFRMGVSLGFPSEISIETTTICNLQCRGCPTGLGQLNRPPMLIPQELFDNITEKNRINFRYFDTIYPFIFGEPLLNNKMIDYLKKLRRISSPYTRIELHTNGNIPDSKELVRRLLGTGVDLISISVDGTDKTAYESFRKGGNFELVFEFVKNLTAAKKEKGLLKPEVVVQMILTRYSESQKGGAKRLKEELGADRLLFKGFFHEFTGLSDEDGYSIAPLQKDLTLNEKDKKAIIEGKKNLCGWAYRAISIMCNGNVTPCCIDFNTVLLDGLKIDRDVSIRDIWNSPKYRRFRKNMLHGKIPICNKCFFS
ncbi:MAG: radical SAM/SPASM domain-containing protein [Candidatus Omnitrophica bacterium]|nr:radical SAM/SPASM domain-containing protein [Candidatus Omnitrophota bacterium]